jgi:hypothetical protein
MRHQLTFAKLVSYDNDDQGIGLEVEISYSETSVKINARIDTGATYSIFERHYGEEPGLDIESGMRHASARQRAVFTPTVFASR